MPPTGAALVGPSEWPRGRAADRWRYNRLPLAGYIDSPPRGEGKGEVCGVRISKGRSPTSGVYLSSMVGPISRKSAGGAALRGVSEELICFWHYSREVPQMAPHGRSFPGLVYEHPRSSTVSSFRETKLALTPASTKGPIASRQGPVLGFRVCQRPDS